MYDFIRACQWAIMRNWKSKKRNRSRDREICDAFLSHSLFLNNKLPLSTVAIDAFVLVSNLDLKGENWMRPNEFSRESQVEIYRGLKLARRF